MSAPAAPDSEYRRRADRYRALLADLDRVGFWLSNARALAFLAALALPLFVWAKKVPPWGNWLALFLGGVFLAVAVLHDRVLKRETQTRHRLAFNERGLKRLDGTWPELPERGERFLVDEHPYAADLNVFGKASLFQLLDATTTRLGEDTLARWLGAPAPPDVASARQPAVRELAARLDFREDLFSLGRTLAEEKVDAGRLLAWAEAPPTPPLHPAVRVASFVLPALTVALYLLDKLEVFPNVFYWGPLFVSTLLAVWISRTASAVFAQVSTPSERFVRYEGVFERLERERFEAPLLTALEQRIRVEGAPPSVEMKRLARSVSFLQLRLQPLLHFPLNAVFMWDAHFLTALEGWHRRCGKAARGWFEALADVEALSSLAGFAFDNPAAGFCYPALVEGGPRLEAKALGHPLIPSARRVTNDVAIPGPGSALLITGSNMAGKTTMLRTLGVNAVLGLAGAPVCAREATLSALDLRTSMRVQDSLAQGLSFFYAELKRLKTVVDAVDGRHPVLFLLDEVLLGTNTAERQLASRAIVKKLVEKGASGAITTHDLALTTLEEETAGKIRNVHFEDQVQDGQMSFDYKMRPGVVHTTNALALLKLAGIDL